MILYPHLPSSFYDRSDTFRRIRRAAFARQVSPDALLAVCLCRASSSLPPGVVLPNGGTLDFVAALIGAPGTGKSQTLRAASELLPDVGTTLDGIPIGSGEGIAAAYVGKPDESNTNPIVNTSALFYVDEGEQLLTVGRREGSTTLNTIRTCWSGGSFGSMNATAERRRVVKAGTYRFALAVGFQPSFAAELLIGKDAGDPQRFLYAGVTHPDIPPIPQAFPEPISLHLTGSSPRLEVHVDPEVLTAIRERRARIATGKEVPDPLDTHRDLLTLKVAALTAYLDRDPDGTLDVTAAVWNDARTIVDNSRAVRDRIVDDSRQVAADRLDESVRNDLQRDALRDEHRYDRARRSMARSMVNAARNANRPVNRSTLSQAVSGKHRNECPVDDAIRHAVEVGTPDGRLRSFGNTGQLWQFAA